MISDLDRWHGAVLRQLFVEWNAAATVRSIDEFGRIDTFIFNGSAFHIRHSGKRLSPWQFTLVPDSLIQLRSMYSRYPNSWLFLVCGIDGIAGLQISEVTTLVQVDSSEPEWIRVSRSRNSMYRASGSQGTLPRAVPKGVGRFVAACRSNDARTVTS